MAKRKEVVEGLAGASLSGGKENADNPASSKKSRRASTASAKGAPAVDESEWRAKGKPVVADATKSGLADAAKEVRKAQQKGLTRRPAVEADTAGPAAAEAPTPAAAGRSGAGGSQAAAAPASDARRATDAVSDSLLEAFRKLQGAYTTLQVKYRGLKQGKLAEIEALNAQQNLLLESHDKVHSDLVLALRAENAALKEDAAAAPLQKQQLEASVAWLTTELRSEKVARQDLERSLIGARAQLERERIQRAAAQERCGSLAACVEDLEWQLKRSGGGGGGAAGGGAARPVCAEGLVRLVGSQAFASEAFETLTGLRWTRGGGPGLHVFTHIASGFCFQLAPVDEEEADEADGAQPPAAAAAAAAAEGGAPSELEYSVQFVPEGMTLPEPFGERFEFRRKQLPKVIGMLLKEISP